MYALCNGRKLYWQDLMDLAYPTSIDIQIRDTKQRNRQQLFSFRAEGEGKHSFTLEFCPLALGGKITHIEENGQVVIEKGDKTLKKQGKKGKEILIYGFTLKQYINNKLVNCARFDRTLTLIEENK